MSTAIKLVRGRIETLNSVNINILDIHSKGLTGEVHYNPGLARDNKGNTWISVRSCIHNPERFKGYQHPVHYQNLLHVGKLNKKTLEVTDIKEVKPEKEYEGFQWGIEDVRLFWREDGLHGIGVILPINEKGIHACQAEILIDHAKGTYKLIKDYGHPKGGAEKNWSPPEIASPLFDFNYSPTEIVKDGKVIGENNPLVIHNGTPLLAYKDGYISIAHTICGVNGEKTYASIALKQDKNGLVTHFSQLFHLDIGYRAHLKERIEFISSALWSSGKEESEMMIGVGVKDELVGIVTLDVSEFNWQEYSDIAWYSFQFATPPSTTEIPTP